MVDFEKLSIIREHLINRASTMRESNGTDRLVKERLIVLREIEMIDTLISGLSQLEKNAQKIIEKYKYI